MKLAPQNISSAPELRNVVFVFTEMLSCSFGVTCRGRSSELELRSLPVATDSHTLRLIRIRIFFFGLV